MYKRNITSINRRNKRLRKRSKLVDTNKNLNIFEVVHDAQIYMCKTPVFDSYGCTRIIFNK